MRIGDSVLADDDLDIHAKIIFVADDLNHSPSRILSRRRPVGNLDINHCVFQVAQFGVTRRRPAAAGARHEPRVRARRTR